MPAITYSDFSGGLDRRLPLNVQEANRLWTLRNAYVTLGKRIKKRPALKQIQTGLTGSVGLKTIDGGLCVFSAVGAGFAPPSGVGSFQLNSYNPGGVGPSTLTSIRYAEMFQGFPYIVATHYTKMPITYPPGRPGPLGTTFKQVPRHHYVDGGVTTLITDANCSHGISATKAASRIFTIGGDVVRYCAAGSARDWTTASDAGFLATGLQQDTRESATAVGTFQDALCVFFPEAAQVWTVAVDPADNAIKKRIQGLGCSYPQTLAGWANDLGFLSSVGFRSMTQSQTTDRIDDNDFGSPVDALVPIDTAISDALSDGTRLGPFSAWLPQFGQYWTIFDNGTTSKAWVFTFSKSSKIACWSEYTFPVRITAPPTSLLGKVYLRTDDVLYEADPATFTDNGTAVGVEVQMAFQDAKTPGVAKQFYGADYALVGTWDTSFLYDPRDSTKETISQALVDDTRPGDMAPVEVVAPSIAPVFRHSADEEAELEVLSLYYNVLATV